MKDKIIGVFIGMFCACLVAFAGTTTTNYSLYKPTAGETGWAGNMNNNSDTIDSQLYSGKSLVDGVEVSRPNFVDSSDINVTASGSSVTSTLSSAVASNIGLGVTAYSLASTALQSESDTLATVTGRGSSTTTNITTTGNIGVGSSSPVQKIDVVGVVRATGGFEGNGLIAHGTVASFPTGYGNYGAVYYSDGYSCARFLGFDGTNYRDTAVGALVGGNFGLMIKSNGVSYFNAGNVGIGSTAPTTALDVVGTVTATAFAGNGAGLTGISTYSAFTKSGNDAYFAESGNLGIGSTAPSVKLDVNGTIQTTARIKGEPKVARWGRTVPATYFAGANIREPVMVNTPAALTVTRVVEEDDINPTTENNQNLKYADDCISFANATVINDLDTTDGKRDDSSITSGAVPAGKCVYRESDAAFDSSVTFESGYMEYDYD